MKSFTHIRVRSRVIIAGAMCAWFAVACGTTDDATPADSSAAPVQAAPAPAPAPAVAPNTPPNVASDTRVAGYIEWIEQARPAGGGVSEWAADGVQKLAEAVDAAAPGKGMQVMFIRSLADSIRQVGPNETRSGNFAQAAFFAASSALGQTKGGDLVNTAAGQIDTRQSVARQRAALDKAFHAAHRAFVAQRTTP